MKRQMTWLIVLLAFAGIVGALVYQSIVGPKNEALVEEKVFGPYFTAIVDGRYAEAWAFYSDERKQNFPLPEFEAHYKKWLADEGPLMRRNVYAARGWSDPFKGKSGLNVDYQLFFKKGLIAISYQLEKQPDGGFRITLGTSTSRSLIRSRLPW